MERYSGESGTRVELSGLNASHTERAVFGNQTMFSRLAWVCANYQTHKSTKIAKPKRNVALQADQLTYLFTCGIVIQILDLCILNF